MGKFKLAIGIHNHQPVGNFDHVIDEAHNKAYKPFIELFKEFPKLKLSLHQSGILWKWQQDRYSNYFDEVQQLIYDGRIELMTGGFYEPVLPSIPDRDKIEQINMLGRYSDGRFAYDTRGLWLTQRVWEPHLPFILKAAGVDYVPVDDTHFLYAGFEQNQLKGVFITEEEGATIKLLPIQKQLRYLIPFGTVEEIIEELKAQAEINPGGLAIYADDGEKFGVWPKTHEHCYKDGWLKDFFQALSDNSDWLEVITLEEAARTKPVGRAYLPSASYSEMLHWALPPIAFSEYEDFEKYLKDKKIFKKYGRFVRGGHWRGFIAKYDETNMMHKRMLMVSEMLDQYIKRTGQKYGRADEAKNFLFAGQCNCAYWHGVFGGLYLPHLRSAIYENLIKAENRLLEPLDKVHKDTVDYDCDGYNEAIITTNKYKAIIKQFDGGILAELDNREFAFNVTDTLRRRKEGYHWKLAEAQLDNEKSGVESKSIHDIVLTKEKGLEKVITDDWHMKRCFIDHFLTDDTDIKKFASGIYGDNGDFVLEPYSLELSNDPGQVRLKRDGKLWLPDGVRKLSIEKSYYFTPESDVININYALTSDEDISGLKFAVESNFNLLAGHADDRYIMFDGERPKKSFLDSQNSCKGCTSVQLRDDYKGFVIGLLSDKEIEFWQTPLFTVSLSEGGFEKVYQGTTILSIFNIDLKKGVPYELSLLLYTGSPDNMPPRMTRKA